MSLIKFWRWTLIVSMATELLSTLFPINLLTSGEFVNVYEYSRDMPFVLLVPLLLAVSLTLLLKDKNKIALSESIAFVSVLGWVMIQGESTPPETYANIAAIPALVILIFSPVHTIIWLYRVSKTAKSPMKRKEKSWQVIRQTRLRLILLSLFTFNLYNIYWIFRNGRGLGLVKHGDRKGLIRGLALYFYPAPLFEKLGINYGKLLGLIYLLFWVGTFWLPYPLSMLGNLSFLPLLLAQAKINMLHETEPVRTGFAAGEVGLLVVGAAIYWLVIIGGPQTV